MIWLLVKYILTAALRDRLFLGFLGLLAVGISLSIFLGSSIITETDQFSLVFAAGSLRIGGLLTLILFIVMHVRRSFETRDVEYMLSRPISRLQYLMAHTIAFSMMAFVMAGLITMALFIVPSDIEVSGIAMWGLSILAEFVMISVASMFFALFLSSAVMASMMTIAFYVLARLMGSILGIIAGEASHGMFFLAEKVMLVISIIIPRLDMMGQTSWLIYGVENSIEWSFIILQGCIFCGFVFAATLFDLCRRQF